MSKADVRIKNIIIRNYKNVIYGDIDFANPQKNYASSIIGLYGQNGSGKTALIDAVLLLKYALCGTPIPEKYAECVNVDADYAQFEFEFSVTDMPSDIEYKVNYSFCVKKGLQDVNRNTDLSVSTEIKHKVIVFDEILKYSYKAGGDRIQRMQNVIDTRTSAVFVPKTKYEELIGKRKNTTNDLLVAKGMASATSRSFVFSRELLNAVRKNCKVQYHVELFNALTFYGNFCLFIIDTASSGMISLDALPLSFRYSRKDMGAIGQLAIPLNGDAVIPEATFRLVEELIRNMNIVLNQLVPGLTISVENLGEQIQASGQKGVRIQLLSYKNSKKIPLQYESEGIKKIIAVLQLLIVVYNEPSITVAIDELDSGVFEYLLGELLRIISEKGKGQLIFTSHNLRPLETLDKGFIAFTTTNPRNRYIRMTNVKTNNNLRDFYYRDIVLGEQDEPVYDTTNNSEISLAFREAGEVYGS